MSIRQKGIVFFSKGKSKTCSEGWIQILKREREGDFSLDFPPFELSVLDEVRSKVGRRGEGFACAPIWWSSDNSKR